MKDGWLIMGSRLWKEGEVRAVTEETGFRDIRYEADVLCRSGFRGPHKRGFATDAEARAWCEEQLRKEAEASQEQAGRGDRQGETGGYDV